MKVYTFDMIYKAELAHLTDKFTEDNGREPSIGEQDAISGAAGRYAREFMEQYAAYQENQRDGERDEKTRI